MNNFLLEKEWNKIKEYNICSYEKLKTMFNNKPNGKCYRKYPSFEWCKENFFFGEYNELLNYYKTTDEIPFYLNKKVGQTIGCLTIVGFHYNEIHDIIVTCHCECGTTKDFNWKKILDNEVKSCGCKRGRRRPTPKISILTVFPDIIKENWDYDKNLVKPSEVSLNSTKSYWWKGFDGSYSMPISALKQSQTGTSFPEQAILYYLNKYNINILSRSKLHYKGTDYEVDIFIPDLKIAIEYDGVRWHKEKLLKEKEKNEAVNQNGIFLIRVREYGLETTDISNGLEIINERDLDDDTFISEAITRIFEVLNAFDNRIEQIKISKTELLKEKGNIYYQYLNSFDNNNICKSWLSKFWSTKNEVKPYLVNENSQDKFWFKTFCGEILDSPQNIQYTLTHNKDSAKLYKLYIEKKACPFNDAQNCPRNFNCFSKNYLANCEYYTGKGSVLNIALDNLFELSKLPSNTKHFQEIFDYCIFSIYRQEPSFFTTALNLYIDKTNKTSKEVHSEIYNSLNHLDVLNWNAYKRFCVILKDDRLFNFFFSHYNYDSLYSKDFPFLNLQNNELIYSLIYMLIYYAEFELLEKTFTAVRKSSTINQYDIFIKNVFLQFYTSGKYHLIWPFVENSEKRQKLFNILSNGISKETKDYINEILSRDLDEFRTEFFTDYANKLIAEKSIDEEMLLEIAARMSDLPLERDKIIKLIKENIKIKNGFRRFI